eukprot:2977102-Rhodomonas_salina.1
MCETGGLEGCSAGSDRARHSHQLFSRGMCVFVCVEPGLSKLPIRELECGESEELKLRGGVIRGSRVLNWRGSLDRIAL